MAVGNTIVIFNFFGIFSFDIFYFGKSEINKEVNSSLRLQKNRRSSVRIPPEGVKRFNAAISVTSFIVINVLTEIQSKTQSNF
jgi:hypothetical protein